MPYSVIDHTADTGILVRASSLPALLTEACRGMLEQITDPETVAPLRKRAIKVEGTDETDLLLNTLREILYLFTGEGMASRELVVLSLDGLTMTGEVAGECFDPDRHPLRSELKAVTYGGGDVRIQSDGYEVMIIFDL